MSVPRWRTREGPHQKDPSSRRSCLSVTCLAAPRHRARAPLAIITTTSFASLGAASIHLVRAPATGSSPLLLAPSARNGPSVGLDATRRGSQEKTRERALSGGVAAKVAGGLSWRGASANARRRIIPGMTNPRNSRPSASRPSRSMAARASRPSERVSRSLLQRRADDRRGSPLLSLASLLSGSRTHSTGRASINRARSTRAEETSLPRRVTQLPKHARDLQRFPASGLPRCRCRPSTVTRVGECGQR